MVNKIQLSAAIVCLSFYSGANAFFICASVVAAKEPASSPEEREEKAGRVDMYLVVAEHVMLFDGREIVTWEEFEQRIAALPNPSLAYVRLYFTSGARAKEQSAQQKLSEISRNFNLGKQRIGSLSQGSRQYDRIKSANDLRPDPRLRATGVVVDREGEPVDDAEVVLVAPSDPSNPYRMHLVRGRIRNRLEHVRTVTDELGGFELYPPLESGFYIVALQPDAGFRLVSSASFEEDRRIKLNPWAGLKCTLGEVPNEKQLASLTTRIAAKDDQPEVDIYQFWSDLGEEPRDHTFSFTHIPPYRETEISREFHEEKGESGAMLGFPGATLSLLPNEIRQISLGPLSEQQQRQLEGARKTMQRLRAH